MRGQIFISHTTHIVPSVTVISEPGSPQFTLPSMTQKPADLGKTRIVSDFKYWLVSLIPKVKLVLKFIGTNYHRPEFIHDKRTIEFDPELMK